MATSDYLRYSAVDLLRVMHGGEVSPVEVVRAFLDRVDLVNPRINAVVTVRAEAALREAREAEQAIVHGRIYGLTGLPITVKDTIETAGIRTTAGSKLLTENVPAADAPIVRRLRAEGAIILGKTNTPEFAMTYSTDNALFGRTVNPWNPDLTPGGSSGGEAANIAAGGSPLGLGSDLGGSIRVPASFCGIVGLRPTVGRLPSAGQIPMLPGPLGRSTVVGPMARTVDDLNHIMGSMVEGWSTHGTRQAVGFHNPDRVAVAFYVEDGVVPVAPEIKAAVRSAAKRLSEVYSHVEEIVPPGLRELRGLWDEIWMASGGARGLLASYVSHDDQLSPALGKLLAASPEAPDPACLSAEAARVDELRVGILRFMQRFPIIVCPVAAGPPTARAGQWTIDGVELSGAQGFEYSYVWSLLGFPALAVPWPPGAMDLTGVQIVGRPGHDEQTLGVGLDLAIQPRWADF